MADRESHKGPWTVRAVPLGVIPLVACERRRVILVNRDHPPPYRSSMVEGALEALGAAGADWSLLD